VAGTLEIAYVQKVARDACPEMSDTAFAKKFRFLKGDAYGVLTRCAYAWVCSGTATLEAALLGAPMGVVYLMPPVTFQIAKRIVKLPYVSLVNLAAEKLIAPEFLQHLATPEALAQHALRTLKNENGIASSQQKDYETLRRRFPPNSARFAASRFLAALERQKVRHP
jgi:lipid-A-disaccharide synthase